MTNGKDRSASAAELRRMAEQRLRERKTEKAPPQTQQDTLRLLHELQVHQIELEMQNEELMHARAQIEAGLERYTDLYDFAPVGYFTMDRDGAIGQVNITGAGLLGIERSRLVGERFGIFVSEEDRPAFTALLRKVFESQEKGSCELRLPKGGSEPHWIHVEATACADGRACHAVVVDISERKQAEDALRESETRFRTLVEHAADAVFVQTDWRFAYVNAAALRLFGATVPEQLLDEPILEHVHPDFRELVAGRIRKSNTERQPVPTLEYVYLRLDGTSVPVEVSAAPIEYLGKPGAVVFARDITERKHAEEALWESEARFRTLFEEEMDGIMLADPDTQQLSLPNPRMCRMLGYSTEEIQGLKVSNIHPAADLPRVTEVFAKQSRGEIDTAVELPVLRKDGGIFYADVIAKPVDVGGRRWLLGIFRDVTERKRAEEELQESEAKFRTLHEMSPIAIVLNRLDNGQFLESNQALWDMTGYTEEEFRSLTYWDITPVEYADMEAKQLELLHTVGRYGPYEKEYIRKDGTRVPVLLSGVRLVAPDGMEFTFSTVQDIAELKERERELRESEQRLRATFDNAALGIVEVDGRSRFIAANDRACQILGYRREDLLRMTSLEVTFPEDRPASKEMIAKLHEGLIDTFDIQKRYLKPDGSPLWAHTTVSGIRDSAGQVVRAIATIEDITERKRAEDILRLNHERAQALLQLNQMTEATLQQITDYALEGAVHITQSQIGYLAFLNDDESILTMHSWSRTAMEQCQIADKPIDYVVKDTGLWGEAVRQRRPVVTNDYAAPSPWKKGYPEGHVHVRRHMNVPVFVGNHIVLVAGVGNKAVDYDETDVQQLTLLMEGMWRLIERTRAAETVAEQADFNQRVFNSTDSHLAVVGPDGVILGANAAWRQFAEKNVGVDGRTWGAGDNYFVPYSEEWGDITHAKDAFEGVRRVQRGELPSFAVEYPCHGPGDNRWFAMTVLPLRGRGGTALITHTNITERKQAEEQRQALNDTLEQRVAERTAEAEWRASQLQRLAGELTQVEQRERHRLAQILHDNMQQVLVAAKFNLDSLRRRLTDREQRGFVQKVDELLGESLATSRSLTAELSPPILHEGSLVQALDWLGRRAKEKHGLSVTVTAEEKTDPASQEVRVMLFQAVQELLLNTAKHAGVDQARVSLTRPDPRHVQILVADEGVGFDPGEKQIEHAGAASSSQFGLFSIRERLELMGGRMEIDSQPGHGTRVTLTAPCHLVSEEAGPAGGTAAEQPVEAGRSAGQDLPHDKKIIHIMLADDHAVVRDGLALLLRMQADMEIVGQTADGQEAVTLALQLQPDVILMDVSMPRMSGVEATRRIIQQAPSIKIIGLSMHEQEDVAVSMKAAGAAVYLTKTAPPETLIAAIYECAGRSAD